MSTDRDLALSAMFANFPAVHREQLASRLTRHEYPPGTEIVRQGETGDALYLIESGVVGVFVRDEMVGIRLVSQLGARQSFGEMALITGAPRSATCTALETTVAYRLSRDVFEAVAQKVPAVALSVARTLAERVQRLTSPSEIRWMSLSGKKTDRRLLSVVPDSVMRQLRAVPIEADKHSVTIGMVDPQDASALQTFQRAFVRFQLRVVVITAEDFERFIGPVIDASAGPRTGEIAVAPEARPVITFIEDDEARAGRAPPVISGPQLIALVDDIIGTALAIGASDIHIEHERKALSVRYRVDGALRPRALPLSHELGKPLVSRLKLLAKLDITETRRPQDGRISLTAGKRQVDLRLSTMPAKFGEKIVLRILDAEANISDLKSLMLVDQVRQTFSDMIFRPHGLILVTGPTGSGKSTTMYSALGVRRNPELNMVTVEDPIEYHLDGATQVQVQAEATTFASILRALLRQDPDIIMVGETRDRETARMAVEASTTGHLVITSMHSNSALEALYRLIDLGLERYVVANTLVGVLHQRLVRKLCLYCSEPHEYPTGIVERLERAKAFAPGEAPTLRRSVGCSRCSGSGYRGRVAVMELLVASDAVRNAFAAGADLMDLKPVAQYGGLIELSRSAGSLLNMGVTTPSEVLHLLSSSRFARPGGATSFPPADT